LLTIFTELAFRLEPILFGPALGTAALLPENIGKLCNILWRRMGCCAFSLNGTWLCEYGRSHSVHSFAVKIPEVTG
jgi:hypothetical protein